MLVDQDVVPVALKAVLVRVDHVGDRGKRVVGQALDVGKEGVGSLGPIRPCNQELEVLHGKLAPVLRVVLVAVLLDGHVGQVLHQILGVERIAVVLDGAEAGKPRSVHVDPERPVGENQKVDPEVKLLPSQQQRVVHILRDHPPRVPHGVPRLGGLPLFELRQLLHDKDPRPKRAPRRLDDPRRVGPLLVLFHKDVVLGRERKRRREKVDLLRLTHPPFLHKLLPVPLDVLHHQILLGDVLVSGKVVQNLVVGQPEPSLWVERRPSSRPRPPVKVPIIICSQQYQC